MKTHLAVIGQGAVTPAGVGLDALLHREPASHQVAPLGYPDETWPVLRVDLKDPALVRWQREPRLRRASPLAYFLVEAASQALAGIDPAERATTGLIVAFSAGCLVYSRRFFSGIVSQGQRTASPALFPETVFNTPVSHVAAVLGLNGAAYALVGDETAWIAALKTAAVWLRAGRVKQVLVLGAEEFDPLVLDAYRCARWLRRAASSNGFLTSEGAAGILIREAISGDSRTLTHLHDGFIYRTKPQAAHAATALLQPTDPLLPCYPTARHNWLGPLEKKATGDRPFLKINAPYLGEAFTASAAWQTVRALHTLTPAQPHLLLPIWGLNHQFGLLELEHENKQSSLDNPRPNRFL
jgi:3-oxoacyl-(acyl-carrier-protein) synthase